MMATRNKEVIQAAIEGLELGNDASTNRSCNSKDVERRESESVSVSPANARRAMSAAARKRISDAMRKRWAAVKKGPASEAVASAPKKAKLS